MAAPLTRREVLAGLSALSAMPAVAQSVVVDARPGAGATLAAGQVARAAPDGYTLLGIPSGHAVSAAMYRKLAYQPVDDFTFISTVTEYPFVLFTHAEHS